MSLVEAHRRELASVLEATDVVYEDAGGALHEQLSYDAREHIESLVQAIADVRWEMDRRLHWIINLRLEEVEVYRTDLAHVVDDLLSKANDLLIYVRCILRKLNSGNDI